MTLSNFPMTLGNEPVLSVTEILDNISTMDDSLLSRLILATYGGASLGARLLSVTLEFSLSCSQSPSLSLSFSLSFELSLSLSLSLCLSVSLDS